MVGSLIYAVTGMQLDLVFTVTLLSQFLSCPTKFHPGAAKCVLWYLKGTYHLKLLFPYGKPLALEGLSGKCPIILEGLSDSNYAGCRDTRRLTLGYIFRLVSCTISWRSRKQRSVATSTLEAEYMVLAMATKQHVWLLRGLTELSYPDIQHLLRWDNFGTIDLVHNPQISDRSKHIQVSYHFVWELVGFHFSHTF